MPVSVGDRVFNAVLALVQALLTTVFNSMINSAFTLFLNPLLQQILRALGLLPTG